MKLQTIALIVSVLSTVLIAGCNITIPPWIPIPTTTTTTQPPVVSTLAFDAVRDHQDSRPTWKCGSLLNTPYGLFTGILNDASRQNIEWWLDGNKIYSGSQETISQPIVWNGAVYVPTESDGDKYFLRYKNGTVKEMFHCRHAAASIVYRNQPCIISSEDRGETLINAETGADVMILDCPPKIGIPFAACYLPSNTNEVIIALCDGDGNEGLITTTGVFIPLVGAIAVENWNGRLVAAANGILYNVDLAGKRVSEFKNVGCAFVNQLWYDADNNILWVSCSGPDKLVFIDSANVVHDVINLNTSNGKRFETRVTKDWWVAGSQATWYKIIKRTTPTPTNNPPTGQYVHLWPNNPVNVHNAADNGPEITGVVFKGNEVRFLGNDSTGSGYFIRAPNTAYKMEYLDNGTFRMSATDFVGASGAKFRYVGCRTGSGGNTMWTDNPAIVPQSEWQKNGNTTRFYWQTVQ